jgi:phosphate transport system permease protein
LNQRELTEKIIKSLLFICAASSIGVVFFLISNIFAVGYPMFFEWIENGFGMVWRQTSDQFGIIHLIFSTLYVGLGSMIIAAAIGVPSAIYLAEFAGPKIRNIIKPSMEMLVGVPSIALGFFGFLVIVEFLVRTVNGGVSVLAAWIVLAIMSLPHIATISEDAIRAVPNAYREAALALGATRWQAIRHVILSSAKSGILASLVLALGNAIGETMAVYMVIGGRTNPAISLDPNISSNVITRIIAVQYSDAEVGSQHWQALFALGIVLFILTMVLNIITTQILRKRANSSVTT